MQPPKRASNKRLWLLLIPATAFATSLFWFYPRDLNLSQVKTSSIKNDKGQASQLLWWTPPEGVEILHAVKYENKVEYGIMPGDWWMDGRCFKVAELGNGPDNMVRVYLSPEAGPASSPENDRTYLAKRKDLSQTTSITRLQNEWSDSFFSSW